MKDVTKSFYAKQQDFLKFTKNSFFYTTCYEKLKK